jgi:ribulose 1,5-bisphosphate synthetase/thiazole synthase
MRVQMRRLSRAKSASALGYPDEEQQMSDDRDDVIVIGSGPGDALLAARLAPTGRRILLLEHRRLSVALAGQLGFADRVRRRCLSGQ